MADRQTKVVSTRCSILWTDAPEMRNFTFPTGNASIDLRLVSNLELQALLGCRIEDGLVVADNLQRTSVANVSRTGEPTGIGSVDLALLEERIAGLASSGRTEEAERLACGCYLKLGFVRTLPTAGFEANAT
jgi:hypothetical protein